MKKHVPYTLLVFILPFILVSCSDDRKMVNMALKKNGKVYLFSSLGEAAVVHSLAEGKAPAVLKDMQVVLEDGQLFTQTAFLKNVAAIFTRSYEIHEVPQGAVAGYLTTNNGRFNQVLEHKHGDEVGQITSQFTATITPTNGNSIAIIWEYAPAQKAIENCEVMSLVVPYVEGSTNEFTTRDFVMVNLSKLLQQINPQAALEFDEQNMVLYIVE